MLSNFPKRFLLQGSWGNSSPESHSPRTWQTALTTGPQVAAKDLVNQRRGLGLAIQPRDSSTRSHSQPSAMATPAGHHCVLRTAPLRALFSGQAAERREQREVAASASLLSQCRSSGGGTSL